MGDFLLTQTQKREDTQTNPSLPTFILVVHSGRYLDTRKTLCCLDKDKEQITALYTKDSINPDK